MFKNLLKALAVVTMAAGLTACGFSSVPAGYTGVKVNKMGGEKGVDLKETGTGWFFTTPNESVYTFPTFNQNFNLNGVKAQDKDGMVVGMPLGIVLRAQEGSAPLLFKTYRKGMDEIVQVNVPQVVRDALNNESSKTTAQAMYGKDREKFIKAVETRVQEHFGPRGIIVESVFLTGQIDLPDTVVAALNRKIEATQKAEQRENELRQTIAEAEKNRAEAQGLKDAAILKAQGEAEALSIKGAALRANPGVVELNAIEKWDGKMPTMMTSGQALPFINVK